MTPRSCLFLIYISIISSWMELMCQIDLILFVWFRCFWVLTCDFGAENAKNKCKGNGFSRFALRASLQALRRCSGQSGMAFGPAIFRGAEAPR